MSDNFLLVSTIISILNEAVYIERGILTIAEQDFPADPMEILIAAGMSTDRTHKIIRNFTGIHPQIPIHILDNPGKIASSDINVDLRQATGKSSSTWMEIGSLRPIMCSDVSKKHISYSLGSLISLLKFASHWDDMQGQTLHFLSRNA